MLMEAPVDHTAAPPPIPSPDLSPFAKGKRTKRLRPNSPLPFTFSPPPLDDDLEVAHCLIILSQGDPHRPVVDEITYTPQQKKHNVGGGGDYVCKTCNRTFSSFQALGGHRTSHRKVKNGGSEKRPTVTVPASVTTFSDDDDLPSLSRTKLSPNALSLQLNTVATTVMPRMHECVYCGAEFTSGQALGGHMRKHRAGPIGSTRPPNVMVVVADTTIEELQLDDSKHRKNIGLSLDLNLPPTVENENLRATVLHPSLEEAKINLSLSTTTPTLLVD